MRKRTLILFFSRGISLQRWEEIGIIDREVEIYKRLLPFVGNNSLFTYRSAEECTFSSKAGRDEHALQQTELSIRNAGLISGGNW